MKVFLLLDQDTRHLEILPVAGEGKPVDIVWIGNAPDEVKNSSLTAALAAYNIINRGGGKICHTIFACTLEEDIARRIYGGSGALAFAVAAIYEMIGTESIKPGFKKDLIFGKRRPSKMDEEKAVIAATGTISDLKQGTIGKVYSINEKLRVAIQRLPDAATILYPQQNDPEIEPELKKAALQKGMRLKPVKALEDLLEPPKRRGYWAMLAILTILIFLLYGITSPKLAQYFLEHEYYSLARSHLHFANKGAFYNGQLKKIFKDFNSPLKAEVVFTVRSSTGREETYSVEMLPRELRLSSQDAFAFRIDPSEPLYAYIYQSSQDGIFKRLYPQSHRGAPNDNMRDSGLESKVRPESQVMLEDAVTSEDYQIAPITNTTTIPGAGIFFKPPARNGNWDICIILSKWRCRNFERMLFIQNHFSRSLEDIAKYNIKEGSIQVKILCLSPRD